MLRELTREEWLRILGIPSKRIPQVLILRGTRNLKSQYESYRGRFQHVLEVGTPNGLIEDLLIGEYSGGQVAYASVYGAAMASEVTHLFGVLGTRCVIQSGCCGAWSQGIEPGDLFIPTAARCGEGAAQYYVGNKNVVVPTVNLNHISEWSNGVSCFHGGIYTTAALFAEGPREIEGWASDGWEAVDMETATTFAVAEHFGMDSAAVLYVFDNPRERADIAMNDQEKDTLRSRGNEAMIDLTFRLVRQFLNGQCDDKGRVAGQETS